MSRLAAGLLAAVFVWAAAAKLRDQPSTVRAFTGAGLPAPATLAVVVPVAELALAGVLLAAPVWGAAGALAVLAGFTTHLALAHRRGVEAGCGCFGGARPAPPRRELARNAALAAIALIVVVAG